MTEMTQSSWRIHLQTSANARIAPSCVSFFLFFFGHKETLLVIWDLFDFFFFFGFALAFLFADKGKRGVRRCVVCLEREWLGVGGWYFYRTDIGSSIEQTSSFADMTGIRCRVLSKLAACEFWLSAVLIRYHKESLSETYVSSLGLLSAFRYLLLQPRTFTRRPQNANKNRGYFSCFVLVIPADIRGIFVEFVWTFYFRQQAEGQMVRMSW